MVSRKIKKHNRNKKKYRRSVKLGRKQNGGVEDTYGTYQHPGVKSKVLDRFRKVPSFAKYWPKSPSRLDFEAKRRTGALFPAPPGDNESENTRGGALGNFSELGPSEGGSADIIKYINREYPSNPFNPFYYDHAKKLLLWWNGKPPVQQGLILGRSEMGNVYILNILNALLTMYQYLHGQNSHKEGGTFPAVAFQDADDRIFERAINFYTSLSDTKTYFGLDHEQSNEDLKEFIITRYISMVPVEYVRKKYEHELELYKNDSEKLKKIRAGLPTIAMLERLHRENPPEKQINVGTGHRNEVIIDDQAEADRLQEEAREENEQKNKKLKEARKKARKEAASTAQVEEAVAAEAAEAAEVVAAEAAEKATALEEVKKLESEILQLESDPKYAKNYNYMDLLKKKIEVQRLNSQYSTSEKARANHEMFIRMFENMIEKVETIPEIEKVNLAELNEKISETPLPNYQGDGNEWAMSLKTIVEKILANKGGGKKKSRKHRNKKHRTRKHRKPKSHKKRKSRSRKKRKSRMGRSPHKTRR